MQTFILTTLLGVFFVVAVAAVADSLRPHRPMASARFSKQTVPLFIQANDGHFEMTFTVHQVITSHFHLVA